MSNFESIDDYLSNKLPELDRKSFEQQMNGDPSLKSEVEFQKQIVEGVRQARALQLKGMLKNVPVNGTTWTVGGKIAAGIITAGIIGTSIYFYSNNKTEVISDLKSPETIVSADPEVQTMDSVNNNEEVINKSEAETPAAEKELKKESKAKKTEKVTTPVQKPDIHPADPTDELSQKEDTEESTPGRAEISLSKMEVLIEPGDKKYNFNYQFSQGRLLLYGPFDKSLYEILEIHGEEHAVFLYYRENYYLLNEKQSKITPLSMIKDTALLKMLKEYRGR